MMGSAPLLALLLLMSDGTRALVSSQSFRTQWFHRRTVPPAAVSESTLSDAIWAEQWWPLCFTAHTSKKAPIAIQLLGAELVLWWNSADGAWHCTRDQCSHRLAPLSEGRIADDGKCIECPYHGWQFEGEGGRCTRMPQRPTGEENESSVRQERAAVLALPTCEAQGMVWVWAGPLFDGAAPQPPSDSSVGPFVIDAIERPGVEHSDYSRDLHMDWSTLCENVMDPAHLPYTHHKTISKRDKAQPIPFANLSPLEPEGFSADRPTEGWPGKVTFRAPHLVLAETHRATDGASGSVGAGSGQFSDWNVVYAVPTSPGKCRLLVRVCFEVAKMKPPLKWIIGFAFTKQPTWLTHLGNHVILEDDNPFLHVQGHFYREGRVGDVSSDNGGIGMANGGKLAPDWQRRLYTPCSSDAMVIAFRRWIDKFTEGKGAAWSKFSSFNPCAATQHRASRQEVLERAKSHVEHCAACSGALSNAIKGRHAADSAVVVALLIASFVSRLRPTAFALAAVAYAVARACASLEQRMTHGIYPPPRNA